MAIAKVNGIDLFYEETGEGFPVIWCHPFGDDHRGWDQQVKYFSRLYRCVTYNSRGRPPSSTPNDQEAYSHKNLHDDLLALIHYLEIRQLHLVGLSAGGGLALNFAIRHPDLCRSLVIASAGTGTSDAEAFAREVQRAVDILQAQDMEGFASFYLDNPSYRTLKRKDSKSWQEFNERFIAQSAQVAALWQKGIRLKRSTVFALKDQLKQLTVPTLVMVGDEDAPSLEPAFFMKGEIPNSGLAVFPKSGHAINLEEPALFNDTVFRFFRCVELGRW